MLTDVLIIITAILVLASIIISIITLKKSKENNKSQEIFDQITVLSQQLTRQNDDSFKDLTSQIARLREDNFRELASIANQIMIKQNADNDLQKERIDSIFKHMTETLMGVDKRSEEMRVSVEKNLKYMAEQNLEMRSSVEKSIKFVSENNTLSIEKMRASVDQSIKFVSEQNAVSVDKMRVAVEEKTEKMRGSVEQNMKFMSEQNNIALEKMRNVVDEKLSATLETRLNKSFEVINQSLLQVNRGLGDMQNLAKDVGGLKSVLQNVKVRGTWAEMQLENLLSQMLTNDQFAKQCVVNKKTSERVDFAIRLPGKEEEVLLPIDSKFPIEEYNRLITASQSGDLEASERALKNLELRVREEAKSISQKYINVPVTTDFAIMYLPIEGLYAEVLRRDGLYEQLQRNYKIIVCGPSTLGAMLSSLQMGFKTVAIEKKSSEIHRLLLVFKTEFSKFNELLEKTQKKISEASHTIDDATRKTRTISKKLNKVEAISFDQVEIKPLEIEEDED